MIVHQLLFDILKESKKRSFDFHFLNNLIYFFPGFLFFSRITAIYIKLMTFDDQFFKNSIFFSWITALIKYIIFWIKGNFFDILKRLSWKKIEILEKNIWGYIKILTFHFFYIIITFWVFPKFVVNLRGLWMTIERQNNE